MNLSKRFPILSLLSVGSILMLSAAGCSNEKEEEPAGTQNASSPQDRKIAEPEEPVSDPGVLKVAGVTFQVPEGWRRAQFTRDQIRINIYHARFLIAAEGVDSEVTVSVAGGGVRGNLERWKGLYPVKDPVEEQFEVDGTTVTWIELTGEFARETFNPDKAERMIGVAIPLAGERVIILKLTGPDKALATLRDSLRTFVKSADMP